MKTPYFLINEQLLNINISNFKSALHNIWPNSKIAYSVKTNSLPWLLKKMKSEGIMAEVVSDEEYQLAILCGFKPHEIVFNGPIKEKEYFIEAIKQGSIVNMDSQKELEMFLTEYQNFNDKIGIRVNVDTSIFNSGDIDYVEDGFRFGFSEPIGDINRVLLSIKSINPQCKIGLHFHCNSITRSLDVYRKLAEYAKYIIEKYRIEPAFIDIGGGFFGGIEGKPKQEQYIQIICDTLKTVVDIDKTVLIIEPGSAIIGSAVEFHTSVVDVKSNGKGIIVTTDGSRINIDPLWARNKYTYRIEPEELNRQIVKKQIVCGYTCMDHDRIFALQDKKLLQVGDKIIYERVGAYTVTFGGPFIKFFPEVYLQNEYNTILIRKKITEKDYYNFHSLGEEILLWKKSKY